MSHQLARLVAGTLVITCLLGLGIAAVGTAGASGTASLAAADDPAFDTDSEWGHNGSIIERTFVNVETGETYELSPDESVDVLPAGEYLEIQKIQTDGEVTERERYVTVSDTAATITPATHESDLQISIVSEGEEFDTSFAPGESVPLWVGVANDSTPVADQELTISVERPDGTVETFNRTTDANGAVQLDYTPPSDVEGEYDVSAGPDSQTSYGFARFVVGPQVQSVNPRIGDTTPTGSEVTSSILVTEAAEPVANSERTLTIRAPDDSTTTRTVVTDEDGYATFNWTPEQSGTYYIETDLPGESGFLDSGEYAAVSRIDGERFSTNADPGDEVTVAGNIIGAAGPGTNVDVEIDVVNATSYEDETVVKTVSTTTDDTGTFIKQIELPTDSDATEYDFRLQTATGDSIASNTISADLRDRSGPDTSDELEIDISGNTSYALPGDDVELTIEATEINASGATSPYANEELTLTPTVSYDQPVEQFTVETNSDGVATVTYTVPSEIPDGNELRFNDVTATYNGTIDEPFFDIGVQQYVLEDEREDIVAGGESTYQVTATDVATGEPVSDVPFMLSAERGDRRASVYDTASARTNSSGVATITTNTPADVSGTVYYGTFARYEPSYSFPTFSVSAYDAAITGLDSYEYQAGETLTVTYEGPTDSTAVLAVRSYDEDVPSPLVVEQVSAGEQLTFTIPSDVPDDTFYSIEALAANQQGQIAEPDDYFSVSSGDGNVAPTAEFAVSPDTPAPGETITLNASASSDSDGSIASYDWDLDDDGTIDATGETTTVAFDEAGSYDATLRVTDDDGATDVTTQTIVVEESTAGNATVSIVPDSVTVAPNGSTTADIAVSGTDDIGAYAFSASVDGADTQITDVTLAGSPGTQNVSISTDGSTAEAQAALAEIDGGQDAVIASVTLAGAPADNGTLSVSVSDVGDLEGNPYEIDQANATATISTQDQIPDVTGDGNPPTDPDGDGLYSDVNGDGETTVSDVQAFFTSYNSDAVQDNSAAFDFNGDGQVTVSDVQALFSDIA